MNLIRRFGLAGLLGAAGAFAIWACADNDYGTSWDAQGSSGILSPGNDTRSNFVLLMADRDATKVADARQMASGIVPFDFPYSVLVDRLTPPRPDVTPGDSSDEDIAEYGLSADNPYFPYDGSNLALCHSNRSGAAEFVAALGADPAVPPNEKKLLLAARDALAHACDKAAQLHFAFDAVASTEGHAFARYAEGTRLFYAEQFPAALQEFGAIGAASSGWLTEAAAYMQFRTALAAAMKASIGQWGDIVAVDKRDRGAIDRADALRERYLAAFPAGRFAESARNLARRIEWLRGDKEALGSAYSAMLSAKVPAGGLPPLKVIEEVDRRFLPSSESAGVTDPDLLAVMDLMRLRPTPEYDKERSCCGAELSRADLQEQQRYFANRPELFGYLLAAEAYYHRHQPREVLALIPDAAHQQRFSYVQFSRQMLRGFALEAVHDPNARAFWLSLLPGAVQPYQRAPVELAIYQHDLKAGVVGRLLETGSPILHPLIRQKIIEDDAGAALLRQQATSGATTQQREVALYLLLADELHHGAYREFLADRELVGPRPQPKGDSRYDYAFWNVADYSPTWRTELTPPPLYIFADGGSDDLQACPNIQTTATSLAAAPEAIGPRLCLAEFIREKGLDRWNEQFDGREIVLRSRNGFAGPPLQRIDIYKAVIASPEATPDQRAFALNRAIRCYAPAGQNGCGLANEDPSIRKARFVELKSKYPNSRWARELKFYW